MTGGECHDRKFVILHLRRRGNMKRANRSAMLRTVCLVLVGCSGGPSVVVDTPTGVTPIYAPPPAMPGGGIGPPPGMQGSLPLPSQMVDRTGSYAGTAVPLDTGGGICIQSAKVGNFFVRGNSVRYGRFRGRIDANNGLQMVNGQQWIIGQFDGATFHGQLDLPGGFNSSGCTYMLSLERIGP
jgi:hypothetical protein